MRLSSAAFALALAACGGSGSHAGSGNDAGGTGPTGSGGDDSGSIPDATTSTNGADTGGEPVTDAGSSISTTEAGSIGEGGPTDGGAPPSCKRGIAANAAPTAVFSPTATSTGIVWWYNWATKPPSSAGPIDFVPMIWGSGSDDASIPATSKYVLGFNEPMIVGQSNMTPAQAAANWPAVEAKANALGVPVISPAVTFCDPSDAAPTSSACSDPSVSDPYTWLQDFFAACANCKVDGIAVHWYNCDLPSLQAYIEGNDAGLAGFVQFGKPIWLTEFSCSNSYSPDQQKAYMQAAVPWLESNPHVMKYAWFSADGIPNALLANPDAGGALTALGQTYVSLAQSCE
jgi:Glycosyl hydrolase catalytic core